MIAYPSISTGGKGKDEKEERIGSQWNSNSCFHSGEHEFLIFRLFRTVGFLVLLIFIVQSASTPPGSRRGGRPLADIQATLISVPRKTYPNPKIGIENARTNNIRFPKEYPGGR